MWASVDHEALGSLLLNPAYFFYRALNVPEGNVGHVGQTVGAGGAEPGYPVVVDPGVGEGEAGVGADGFPGQAEGGVEDDGVDAALVEDLDVLMGVIGAGGPTLGVADFAGGEVVLDGVRGVGLAGTRSAEYAAVQEVAVVVPVVHAHVLPSLFVLFEAESAVPVLRLDVFEPEVGGFEDVAVYVYEPGRGHLLSPLICC